MNKYLLDETLNLNEVLISLKKLLADKEKKGLFTDVELLVEQIANIYQTQGYWHRALKHYRLLVVNLSEKYNKTYHEELLSRLNTNLNYVYSNWAGR